MKIWRFTQTPYNDAMLIDTHAHLDSLSCRAKSRHLWIECSRRESEVPDLRSE